MSAAGTIRTAAQAMAPVAVTMAGKAEKRWPHIGASA